MPAGEIETPAYGNIHGLPRSTCRLCGECDIGCNYGAKNTLDHTYLSAAQHAGADIRVRHEVKGFRPLGATRAAATRSRTSSTTGADGRARRSDAARRSTIRCERLVLAAGTFGTTYLLLRNRAAFPGLERARSAPGSPATATCWRSCMNAARDGLGRDLGANTGPVITSAIRVADDASTATARRGAATTSRTPATRPSPPGSPRPARASARSPGRSSSATGRPSRT